VEVKVSTNLQARAQSPNPPANAKQKKNVGKGQTAFSTANTPDDGDALWVEQIDINNDGSTEEVELLYDDEDKVLYAYAKVACDCASRGRSKGGLLVAIHCKGNSRGKPAGSGWWVARIDIGECGAKSAGLWLQVRYKRESNRIGHGGLRRRTGRHRCCDTQEVSRAR
jgi:hypothetical protein